MSKSQKFAENPEARVDEKAARFPFGVVWPYAGRTKTSDIETLERSGWYLCDGRELTRKLPGFDAIGTIYGIGDGVDTFNIPDYRGRFLRGVDNPTRENSAGRDPDSEFRSGTNGGFAGEGVGSTQEDQFASHSHKLGLVSRAAFCIH